MLAKTEAVSMCPERTQFPTAPDYETKSQVARRLNVSKQTIDNLMRQRRLPFIKLTSKIVRFPKAEVDAYLAQHFRINARGQETSWNFRVGCLRVTHHCE
jgi:excisionase family DNA binding protein